MTAAIRSFPAAPARLQPTDLARLFATQPTPWIIGGTLAAGIGARLVLGGFTVWDLVAAALVLAFEPFTEWAIHVFVLHFKPRTVRGRRVDLYAAKKHRAHHADPKAIPLIFAPMRVIVPALVIGPLVFMVIAGFDWRVGLSGYVAGVAMLLFYEWTHFVCHAPYRPKSWYFKRVQRLHRLHHFRNEHYWMGVTVHAADRVLHTFPDKDAVPLSKTARTLGVGV